MMFPSLVRLVALLAACAFAGTARAEAPSPGTWHVFLIAADREEPVFDNAVDRLAIEFKNQYGIAAERFTARTRKPPGKRDATWQEIDRVVRGRAMAAGDACLFYFTSHGEEDGLYMARHRSLLPPNTLAQLLDSTCGKRPTVVIISACYSGTFLKSALPTENRVILTAARADRSSFGCSSDESLTVYDRCFLNSWRASATWPDLHAAISGCVQSTERARRFTPPSEPQAFFGRTMRNFPVHPPARRS